MKVILLATAALMAGTAAPCAQARPNTTAMTCSQASSLVQSSHVIILNTGPMTYDRYVSEDIYCEPDAYAAPAFEPTADNRECLIGYYCHLKATNESH